MTRLSSRAVMGALVALGITAGALSARAWTQKGPFTATIHGHEFQSAEVAGGDDCSLSVTLRFDAPPDKYQRKNPVSNVYRFRARIQLSEGKQILSRAFNNRQPGARSYHFTYDTTSEGCWGKRPHKLANVDIEGCRGQGCRVVEFK
jgi:hypothetical protein